MAQTISNRVASSSSYSSLLKRTRPIVSENLFFSDVRAQFPSLREIRLSKHDLVASIADMDDARRRSCRREGVLAEGDALIKSLTPILKIMSFWGLYQDTHMHDDKNIRKDTTGCKTFGTTVKYSTVFIILSWFYTLRFLSVFNSKDFDFFGTLVVNKLTCLSMFCLCTVVHTTYFIAAFSGTLNRVLHDLRSATDLVDGVACPEP